MEQRPGIEHLLRECAPQVLAALTRRHGDFAAAEDAVQEALLAAAQQWPTAGVPQNPRGWLYHVAVRRLTDQLRSEAARQRRQDEVASVVAAEWAFLPPVDHELVVEQDDTLLLLFMCCHPSLTPASAIALTLRAVGGLTTAEIASAFMVPEATLAQRISRAKQTIKTSEEPLRRPTTAEFAERLRSVLHVLYLMFNEGYASTQGAQLQRADLSNEAIRLTRTLHALVPEDLEVIGLLALLLLTDARRPARTGPSGELVPLDEQDRALWIQDLIREGSQLVERIVARGSIGYYGLQAAVAALHDAAPSTHATDWPQILALYEALKTMTDNPMVALNHAIATAMVYGPVAGLALLDDLETDSRIAGHYRLAAVRAHLYERAGDAERARVHYHAAAERTASAPERDYLLMKAARTVACCVLLWFAAATAAAQTPRPLLPIEFENSAEFAWLRKPVIAARVIDDLTRPETWRMTGTGTLTFPSEPRLGDLRVLRVDMQMFVDSPAPTRNRLSSINLRRALNAEDWRAYNRLSMWIRPEVSGLPMLPLQIVLHNEGAEKVPDAYNREGIHYVTLTNNVWQQVVWEIEPLARDRVTLLEFGYWINKMLAAPTDRVAFEIGRIELQRVTPDHHTGWSVAPRRIAFSHTGYQTGLSKTALASDLAAREFTVLRVDHSALGAVVLRKPVRTVQTRLGSFQELDFSELNSPGTYVIRAGDIVSRSFRIDRDVWETTVWKALNYMYGNRCGFAVPGSHDIDHLDWFATHGNQRIVMSGGWHDAGDLSQGLINTGEATYSLFALAERLRARGDKPELLARVLEEARWGLDWVLRVRFPGGYRMSFASHNLWTNNIVGDADDRTREARNNPNANYIAAAAGAIAYRVLQHDDPALAERALSIAEDDWSHAIVGVEGPSTWHTPAFAATRLELSGIGITASIELFRATRKQKYADKAVELARIVVDAQQKRPVGSSVPLAGFFYTGPERDTIFHQFHRGNDQAPIVALSQLIETLPNHADRAKWQATVALYVDYLKRGASTTAPYQVLPAYVYRLGDEVKEVPDSGALHQATRAAYRAQVLAGLPMGGEWYLRAFPVWFARRGNYGVLLSQAKALSTAARLLNDSSALDLAQRQAQWVVGRNPFVQSTMYGEGYDWAQQYSVSAGDFVGGLPVGMQSRGTTDLPYWPSQNMYVYKEVWTHSVSRWLWLMADLL